MTNKDENLEDAPAEKLPTSKNYPLSAILPDYITFNAGPMFFLERSLFWYWLIGAIPPRGGKRIKDRGGNVFPQNERKGIKSPVPIYEGFGNTLETADFPTEGQF